MRFNLNFVLQSLLRLFLAAIVTSSALLITAPVQQALADEVKAAEAEVLHRQEFLTNDIPKPDSKGGMKVLFLDADATLRISKKGKNYATDAHDYSILPNVASVLRQKNSEGYLIVIVSNQRDAAQTLPLSQIDGAFYNMIQELKTDGAIIAYYDYAEKRDENRKPDVGMANRLEQKLKEKFGAQTFIDKETSLMVGDSGWARAIEEKEADVRPDGRPGFSMSSNDRLFANNYKIRYIEPQFYFDWIKYDTEIIETQEQLRTIRERISDCSQIKNL